MVTFPVFPLLKEKPATEGAISYYLFDGNIRIVDDTSVVGTTLGQRRLHLLNILKNDETKLFKLSKAMYFLGDLIKYTQGSQWFVDNTGFIFEYKKSIRVPLEFRKIKQIIPITTGGAILEIEGLPTRYKCLYSVKDEKYAGVLRLSPFEYILYGVYEEQYDNTYRKV